MRISDWSSDVCSSDLSRARRQSSPFIAMRTASRARVEISRSLPSVPLRVRGRNERENGGIRMDQMEGESARTPTFMSSLAQRLRDEDGVDAALDRKSTRLNSSH